MDGEKDMNKEPADGNKCPNPRSSTFSAVPLPKEDTEMVYKHEEKWLTSLVIRKVQVKTRSYFLPARLTKRRGRKKRRKERKKRKKGEKHTSCVGRTWRDVHSHIMTEGSLGTPFVEGNLRIAIKLVT